MNILFVSHDGDSLGLAMRTREEGHPTTLYIENERAAFVGNGLVVKPAFARHLLKLNGEAVASSINQLISETSPDLIIIDSARLGKVGDYLREKGRVVFGGSKWSDTLESSSGYASSVLRRIGIKTIELELAGVEVECGAWWNGIELLSPYLALNEKRFMTGSLGCLVESAGNIVLSLPTKSLLFKKSMELMKGMLKKSKWRGAISIKLILNESDLGGVGFTVSTLYFPSLLETYKGSTVDLLWSIASGKRFEGEFTTDCALSLLLSIPPYPLSMPAKNETLLGVSPSNLRYLHLLDVTKMVEVYETAVSDGRVAWVTARGRNIGEAKKRAYKTATNLQVTDLQYRTDIGDNAIVKLRKLREWKWI